MTEIGLVGPGVLGRTLALSLPADTYMLGPVLSSSKVSSRRAVREMKRGYAVERWDELGAAGTILVAVPQNQLADVLEAAADDLSATAGKKFLLTGILGRPARQAIARLEDAGAQVGGLLPIAHFRRPSLVPPETSFAIWGAPGAIRSARLLVKALRGQQCAIDPQSAAETLLAISLVSGVLTTSFELAVRRLVEAGFARYRAIEALAPLADACVQEHRRSRTQPPAHRFPTTCAQLLKAVERTEPSQALLCQAALRLACEEMA